MFQVTNAEWGDLQSQIATLSLTSQNATLKDNRGKHRKYLPYIFTEQGVAGLSGVLKSETGAKVHVAIMRAFVAMRKLLKENLLVAYRLEKIELKQLEAIYQQKLLNLEELKKSILQKAFAGELPSPEGVAYVNDGYSPSSNKQTTITSPEGA